MSTLASQELWSIFDARRVKAPELRGLDASFNAMRGRFANRKPVLSQLKAQAERIEKLEPEIQNLGSTHFREAVAEVRDGHPQRLAHAVPSGVGEVPQVEQAIVEDAIVAAGELHEAGNEAVVDDLRIAGNSPVGQCANAAVIGQGRNSAR